MSETPNISVPATAIINSQSRLFCTRLGLEGRYLADHVIELRLQRHDTFVEHADGLAEFGDRQFRARKTLFEFDGLREGEDVARRQQFVGIAHASDCSLNVVKCKAEPNP